MYRYNHLRVLSSALLIAALLLLLAVTVQAQQNNEQTTGSADIGTCGGCFCIPSETGICPLQDIPSNDFTQLIPAYQRLTLMNPIALIDFCDPYNDSECVTEPPLDPTAGACVVAYDEDADDVCTSTGTSSYRLLNYPGTADEAVTAGLDVTHAGPCGACSSLQDLAVYMERSADLRARSTICAIRGSTSAQDGVNCFINEGFTQQCAQVWYYNTKTTNEVCGSTCLLFVVSAEPNTGSAPECLLAECLQCDEDNAGPVFMQYAGRTRRTSGLLSSIVRPCADVALVVEHGLPPVCVTPTTISGAAAGWYFERLYTAAVVGFGVVSLLLI
jgi:hypothetical protein